VVGTFPGFVGNPLEKRQAATCRFSEEFRANPGNVSTSGKKEILTQKRVVHEIAVYKYKPLGF
jgi:hypothetical protein